MKYARAAIATVLAAIAITAPADEQISPQHTLSIAKMAGACGILDSMIQFQTTTKMPGGKEFVARFWAVEAARLGLSVEQLSTTCNRSVATYDKIWNAPDAQ